MPTVDSEVTDGNDIDIRSYPMPSYTQTSVVLPPITTLLPSRL